MDGEREEFLLSEVGRGNRQAFQTLFEEAGPIVAEQLGRSSIPQHAARPAFIEMFGQIWEGSYQLPITPGLSLMDWMCRLAINAAKTHTHGGETPIVIDETLWNDVSKHAFPESWRNILRRLDIFAVVICAFVWAIILLVLGPP